MSEIIGIFSEGLSWKDKERLFLMHNTVCDETVYILKYISFFDLNRYFSQMNVYLDKYTL